MQKVPKVLESEPLIDAVFEVRLNGKPSLADTLLGYLFHQLEPRPALTRLPPAEIPQPMRANDPNLRFQPLFRLEWSQYFIAVGDQNIVISCRLPYPKWPSFRSTILDLTKRIANLGITGAVTRYSVKYVNLIQAQNLAEQTSKIKMAITLGSVKVKADPVNLQVHRREGDILHILSVFIGAEIKLPNGERVSGAVVDIDSIRNVDIPNFETFANDLEPGLEQLKQANKMMFFGCLTDATIEAMGPAYE